MSIWVFLWLVLSVLLLGFSAWTFWVLHRQKESWRAFAKECDLYFTAGSFNDSPKIEGMYKGYQVNLFTGQHTQQDERKNKKMTAIEIELKSTLPFEGGMGTGGMGELIRQLDYAHNVSPPIDDWVHKVKIKVDEPAMLLAYLNDKRIQGLSDLMRVVHAWLIFVTMKNQTLLRLDMSNPLQDPQKMKVLLNKMIAVAKELELGNGEKALLETKRGVEVKQSEPVGEVAEEKVSSFLSLELEEDDDTPSEIDEESKMEERPSKPALE